jgi:PAS domain S-box-containing protein
MTFDIARPEVRRTEMEAVRQRLAGLGPTFEARAMDLLCCVLASTADFVALTDPDGAVLFVNHVSEGTSHERVVGTSIYDYTLPPQKAAYRASVETVLRTREPGTAECDIRFSDGRFGRFESRIAPICDGDRIIALLHSASDVTARERAGQALRKSEIKLRMAVDAAGIGLWSWDTRTDDVAWEDALCTIFGLPPGSAPRGREGYLSLVHPEDRAHAGETIGRGVAAGKWEDEYRVLHADGSARWVMAKGVVLHEEGHDVVLGAVIDVTERRQRDEQRRQAQKLEAIGQLTAGIAHNFNNMLMGVLPNLELAAKVAPPPLVPLLRGAEQAARRAADLVSQLMTYAGRNRAAQRTTESLGALVERTVAICRTTFDRRIAFDVRYDPDACALVDGVQLEQALLNILINARDAIGASLPEEPRIEVSVSIVRAGAPELAAHGGAEDHARVRVVDNGAGMDSATLARIYEPFFTTKEVGRGTGLGLATTHAIVREHGGWVACQSAAGKGTTFSVYLPQEGKAVVARERMEAPPAEGTETILIVDDEPAIRQVVSLMLESAGFTARTATCGSEAIALLSDAPTASEVALVLLDVSMPGMPGRELRERIRELAPHARIVYFTGYAFDATDSDDTVLEKPVSQARLLATIREVLDRPRP